MLYIVVNNSFPPMIRSYHPEYTRSRPISEVKLDWAGPVLWTEMTREAPVTNLLLGVINTIFMQHHCAVDHTKSHCLCTHLRTFSIFFFFTDCRITTFPTNNRHHGIRYERRSISSSVFLLIKAADGGSYVL